MQLWNTTRLVRFRPTGERGACVLSTCVDVYTLRPLRMYQAPHTYVCVLVHLFWHQLHTCRRVCALTCQPGSHSEAFSFFFFFLMSHNPSRGACLKLLSRGWCSFPLPSSTMGSTFVPVHARINRVPPQIVLKFFTLQAESNSNLLGGSP